MIYIRGHHSDFDDWRAVWAVNLDAPLDLMRLLTPHCEHIRIIKTQQHTGLKPKRCHTPS